MSHSLFSFGFGGKRKEPATTNDDVEVNSPNSSTTCKKAKPSSERSLTKVKVRAWRQNWMTEFDWVYFDEEKKLMFCRICQRGNEKNSFVSGNSDFQKSSLQRHQHSNSHKQAISTTLAQNSFKKVLDNVNKTSTTTKTAMMRTVYYLAKEELPTLKFNSLIDLQVSLTF